MLKNLAPISFFFLLCLISCKHEMRAINYGKDNCEQCRMTVMNPQFGAGLLTSKGKVLTFDSGECLIRYLKTNKINKNDQYFVSDYNKPGTLLNATKASFLHSDNIQSPMGGNLAAFLNLASAQKLQIDLGGELLTWEELIRK